ncbi:MAG: hypothetical protein IT522_06810 [Burkholderiales bacterium]|nr:hypothetical protein [Burkholderiales bacterium]
MTGIAAPPGRVMAAAHHARSPAARCLRIGRLSLALGVLSLAGCAPTTLTVTKALAVEGREIAPYEFHEECGEIAAGERIDFRFTATRPVRFAIYYTDGGMRIAPVVRDDVTEGSGVFPPSVGRRYCARWDVGREGAILDYRIRVLLPQRPG